MLVLGGGLAGVSAALRAAELGGRVGLVESGLIGGVGFQRRHALNLIVNESTPLSWNKYKTILQSKTEEYSQSIKDDLNAAGVTIIEGEGTLVSPVEIAVKKNNGESTLLKGTSVILAYGSNSRYPATLPHEDNVVISIDEVSSLTELPEKVLIMGGGTFAGETALGLQKRGCKVFLSYQQKELLPQMDEDFNVYLERHFKQKKIKILAGKKLISFYKNGTELEITLETGIKLSVDQIIIAEDRLGKAETSGLEKLGIRLGGDQEIQVDESMSTSVTGVYAVGSITGELTSDTLSQKEGKVAAENAMGKKRKLNREWVFQIGHFSPDIAHVGCSMKTAPQQGFHPVEGVYEEESEKIIHSFHGPNVAKCKIVADKRSRLVVGVQVISSHAPEWMPMLLLLIKKGITVGNLANSISSEGANFEGLREAARVCLRALKS